jgi:hypothetical protein
LLLLVTAAALSPPQARSRSLQPNSLARSWSSFRPCRADQDLELGDRRRDIAATDAPRPSSLAC